jgi:hypothetical protein
MKNNSASLTVVAAIAAGVVGFALLRPQAPRGNAVQVIAAIDASASARRKLPDGGTLLGRSIVTLAKAGTRLDQSRDRLAIFRVDREVKEFYDELAPASREKFQWLLVRQTEKPAPDGTFPAKFWTEAARRAAAVTGPVAIIYAGDGDNDDLTAQAEQDMKAAARQLAANPRVCDVSIVGASPKNWERLREIFGVLGDRLHIHAPDQMNPTSLLERLNAARSARKGQQR